MKRRTKILTGAIASTVVVAAVVMGAVERRAEALNYQSDVGMQFTFNSTISVTLSSSDLVISDLAPGAAADSNEITVSVGTNASGGYALYATAGNANYAGSSNFGVNDLVLTNGGVVDPTQTHKFTSLATDASVASMSSASPNTWGYAYATYNTSGATWNSYSNYSGLPVYTSETGAELISTTAAVDNRQVKFKIAANAANTQIAGEYTNVVNFYAVANPEPDNSMQGFAAGLAETTCSAMNVGDTFTLTDSRDSTPYTIGKLADQKCWMLDNLALDVVAKIDNMNETNTNASNTTLGYLKNGGGSTTEGDPTYKYASAGVANWTTSYSYSAPLVNMSYKDTVPSDAPANGQGNNKIGGYYNYCAASAGSYCYGGGTSAGTSSGNATEDICPKGWRLPGGGSTVNLTVTPPTGEYYNLYNGGFGYDTVTNYRNALSLPLSGYFLNGSSDYQGSYGLWWSSTRNDNYSMYYLNAGTGNIYPANYTNRNSGYSIRCVLGS